MPKHPDNCISLHRFRNTVGINPPDGPTFYLTASAAFGVAAQLNCVAADIRTRSFVNSKVDTAAFDIDEQSTDAPFTVIGRLYETDDVEIFHTIATNKGLAEAAFVQKLADAYDCTVENIKNRGYDIYAVFYGHQQKI